jgi:hypothetical protein
MYDAWWQAILINDKIIFNINNLKSIFALARTLPFVTSNDLNEEV